MTVNFNTAPMTSYNIGNVLCQSKSGAIANGTRFLNQSSSINFKTGRNKLITGVLEKQGKDFADIYSYIFRAGSKIGSSFSKVEKLARNGNASKTFLVNGIRRLKISHKAGKLAGITLYNSKGVKLGLNFLKKIVK